ncbi:MAG: 50S ribosome-binding GTPase [Leptospiraceae bacterium]|nr:50S ribosome-binding GTPase [Leptospiraceae bacterium]
MAIDRKRTAELLETIDNLFNHTVGEVLPSQAVQFMRKSIMGPALDEIRGLIANSRPPILFLAGRSGHGKSSLINALTGRLVAPIGDIRPTTPESTPYLVQFNERFSSWQVIDSRGVFESTRPDQAANRDPASILMDDLAKYKPDVILHVISATEIRNLAPDIQLFRDIQNRYQGETTSPIPVITVISKADTLGNPRNWPPEEMPHKAALIKEALDYFNTEILNITMQPINPNFALYGSRSQNPMQPGVIPVCALQDNLWNIETLQDFIGTWLPESSLLEYYQALQRKEQLRQISSNLINRFALIASGIGASPAPLSDFAALIPLQLLMIAFIGGLSCKPVSKETATEYLSAAGFNVAATSGLRLLSAQLLKLLPVGGWAASSTLAGSSTWALGKAAEAWFFGGEVVDPGHFKGQWSSSQADLLA